MNTVLLYGPREDIDTTNILLAALRSVSKSALLITAKSVSLVPKGAESPDFVVIDDPGIDNICIDGAILLFKRHTVLSAAGIPPACCAICDPDDHVPIEMLSREHIQTVTCGLSQKDTVTFSSLGADSAQVSL